MNLKTVYKINVMIFNVFQTMEFADARDDVRAIDFKAKNKWKWGLDSGHSFRINYQEDKT